MAATITWNGKQAVIALKESTGKGLIAAALFLQARHKQALNLSNPRPYKTPSQPGEYPRKRTGQLQAGVLYHPTSAAEAGRTGRVAIGYSPQAFYGGILEARGRLGLIDTLRKFQAQIVALIGGGA